MLDTDAIRPFLHIVADEEQGRGNRIAAMRTLVGLPLSEDAWRSVASASAGLLGDLARAAMDVDVIDLFSRIPVRSIRETLRRVALDADHPSGIRCATVLADRGDPAATDRLATIATEPDHPSSLDCAIFLARRGDTRGANRLLTELDSTRAEEAAERLAGLPIERITDLSRTPLLRAAASDSPMVRFWSRLALARLGDLEALDRIWESLRSAESHQTPPLFWGDPWRPYNALAAARPLPAELRDILVARYQRELDELQAREGPNATLDRDLALFVGGLTGIVDVYGERREEPTRESEAELTPTAAARTTESGDLNDIVQRLLARPFAEDESPYAPRRPALNASPEEAAALRSLPPERAGQLMMAALNAALAATRIRRPSPPPPLLTNEEVWGNALLDFARALPSRIELPVGALIERLSRARTQLPVAALAWVLSRVGPEALVAELGTRIHRAPEAGWKSPVDGYPFPYEEFPPGVEIENDLLSWTAAIVARLGEVPPFKSEGGAGPSDVQGREGAASAELIDDSARAKAALSAESVPPAPTREIRAPVKKRHAVKKGPIPQPDPRYIQPKVSRLDPAGVVEDPPVWVEKVEHVVLIRIGPPEAGWKTPENLVSFPYEELPPGEEHTLRVVLSEPSHLSHPLLKEVRIRSSGPSTEAEFRITPRSGEPRFRARIAVAHRNRILQTAMLTGRVVARASHAEPGDKISHEIEAVVRPTLHGLEGRTAFNVALAVNHTPQGEPGLLAVADEHATVRSFSEVKDKIAEIGNILSRVASDAATYANGLREKEGVAVLRELASHGRRLYDFLIADQGVCEKLKDDTSRLQVINLTPNAYFPAEFMYDFARPVRGADLCNKAREAFDTLDFSQPCKREDHETGNEVCPFGFWGLRRVFERHACVPKNHEGITGDFVLQAEPTATRDVVSLAGNCIVGLSQQVELEQGGATQDLLANLKASIPLAVEWVSNWDGWPNHVEQLTPSLIVTLPHAQKWEGEYSLEIGGEFRDGGEIGTKGRHYVLASETAPSPMVLLLGCNTTLPDRPIDSYVGDFRHAGAAIVVSTVGSVLGSHARKAAEELVAALFKEAAAEPRPLGVLLRDVRRRCLGKNLLMALCLAAFGDADWHVHAPKPGGSHVPH
jgi:hypothetical protein